MTAPPQKPTPREALAAWVCLSLAGAVTLWSLNGSPAELQDALQAQAKWQRTPFREIAGTRWLILGYGPIGRAIAERAKAFGAHVTVVRRTPQAGPGVDRAGTLADLPRFLPETDVVVLACPLNEATRGVAGSAFFDALKPGATLANIARGGYVLRDCDGTPDVLLIATGSEVALAMGAAETLAAEGIAARVVSMPSTDVFDRQDADYRASVLPSSVAKRVAVEAGVTDGWWRFVGPQGRVLGVDRFGESAPAAELFEHYGFTIDNVVAAAKEVLN